MGASCQAAVEGIIEEGIMTVGTRDPTHPSDFGDEDWGGGCQVDDFRTVRSWACNPLTATFANEETVARAPHIFPARGCASDCIAGVAFHTMLVLFTGDINRVAYFAADQVHASGQGVAVGWRFIWHNR